jgi:pimeloyl-ACP methyl ester carboxylesterase
VNAPRVVYLHGFASGPSSSKARFFAERFQGEGVEVAVPDLAEGDFEHLTITRQLAVVGRERPVVLIGSSLGGYLAALYAARHTEVAKIMLMAPAFGFPRRWPEALTPAELADWRRTGYREAYHYSEGRMRRVWYGLIEDGQRYEDYPGVGQPALVFHGRRDEVVSPDYSVEFARARPNVQLVLTDSDHQLLDVLEEIWEKTRSFVL